ncbi:MAG: helix-turn-helix domain-containing protein [Cyanophyceae cyanobacterium]
MNRFNSEQVTQLKEIGTYLRQKRLEQSVSLRQVSSRTLIRSGVLKALEEGELQELPEPVYTQNLIRHYGSALDVDGEALAKTLINHPTPVPDDVPASAAPPQTLKRRVGLLMGAVLLAAVIGSLGYLFLRSPAVEDNPGSVTSGQ